MPATDRPPSFPMYPRDFLGDKNVEALEALPYPRGHVAAWAYMRLILKSWEEAQPGVLPDDDIILAGLSRLGPKKWAEYRSVIAKCFVVRDGKWTQKRLVRERELQLERRTQAIEAGRNGGRKSARRRKKRSTATGSLKRPLSELGPGPVYRGGSPPAVASASAVASAGESQSQNRTVPSTELSAAPPIAATAGTADFPNRSEPGNGAPESRAMVGIGPVVSGLMSGLKAPGAEPPAEPGRGIRAYRGTLTGADLSTDEGIATERDEQLRRFRESEARREP